MPASVVFDDDDIGCTAPNEGSGFAPVLLDPDESKESPRAFILPKAAADDASLFFESSDFPSIILFCCCSEDVFGAERANMEVLELVSFDLVVKSFEKGFLGACLGIGGNGADKEEFDFVVGFFFEGSDVTVSLFLSLENGLVGALFDIGGKAAFAPTLRFVCPTLEWT